jgi:hypothetical protein
MTENQFLLLSVIYAYGAGFRSGNGVAVTEMLMPAELKQSYIYWIIFSAAVLIWPILTGIRLAARLWMAVAERIKE